MDGSGHYLDPFLIRTEQDLRDIRLNSSAHYKLINNIALVEEWASIPTFSGTLDGAGHTISGIRWAAPSGTSGFFNQATSQPTIENVVMQTSSAGIAGDGSSYKGLLFGMTTPGSVVTIRRAGFFGYLNTGGDRAGGLIGYFAGSSKAFIQNVIMGVELSSEAVRTGSIFGYLEVPATDFGLVSNVYYNSSLTPSSRPVGSGNSMPEPIAYTDPSNPAQFPNLDFVNTWEIKNGLPSLITTPKLWSGTSYIAGSGDGILTVKGVPSERDIYLLDAGTMFLVKKIKSLPNGHYIFSGLDVDREYIVMARDEMREFEPFAWDYVKPANDLTIDEQQALWASWQT